MARNVTGKRVTFRRAGMLTYGIGGIVELDEGGHGRTVAVEGDMLTVEILTDEEYAQIQRTRW